MEAQKIPHYVKPALGLLHGGATLAREASHTEEAIKGGGFVYFTLPDGRSVRPASGKWLIENSFVSPTGDDLFPGGSQTYRLA